MSPKESWLALMPAEPISENRSHMGANHRDTDMDESNYRGLPITNNMPLARNGRTFDGLGYLGAMRVYTY